MKQEREFLLRKLIEHEPSTLELQQNFDQKIKKRKNSSSDASSVNKPVVKKPQQTLKKAIGALLPKLPLVIDGGLTLLNLGRIVLDRPSYHNDTCIYPVGYKTAVVYRNKAFICRIIDNGAMPLFECSSSMNPTLTFSGSTSDDCHAELLQYFENMPYVLDGDKFFGLENKRIKEFINMLPNARRLIKIKQENLAYYDDNAHNYMS